MRKLCEGQQLSRLLLLIIATYPENSAIARTTVSSIATYKATEELFETGCLNCFSLFRSEGNGITLF
jgi:hypothetical protein